MTWSGRRDCSTISQAGMSETQAEVLYEPEEVNYFLNLRGDTSSSCGCFSLLSQRVSERVASGQIVLSDGGCPEGC
jgi:hypothetical protein